MFPQRTRILRGVLLIFDTGGVEDGSDHRLPHGFEVRRKRIAGNDGSEVGDSSENMGKEA